MPRNKKPGITKSLKSPQKIPMKTEDLLATLHALHLVRTELRAEMKARFHQMESRFKQINSRFEQNESRFERVDASFEGVDARSEKITSENARIGLLVEEQHSRNAIVMEGLTGIFQRQERVESRVTDVESLVQGIASRARQGIPSK